MKEKLQISEIKATKGACFFGKFKVSHQVTSQGGGSVPVSPNDTWWKGV